MPVFRGSKLKRKFKQTQLTFAKKSAKRNVGRDAGYVMRGGGPTYLSKKRRVRRVQKICLGLAEQKRKFNPIAKYELYHNTGTAGEIGVYYLNGTGNSSQLTQGLTDTGRTGDSIYVSGFSLQLLLGQKQDRPNVTFKIYVVSCPAINVATTYSSIFVSNTGNCLLDTVNTERFTVRYAKTIHRKWDSTVGKECTFPVKLWIPERRFYRYRGANATEHDADMLLLCVMAYDAYGSLLSDNIGYVQGGAVMYYRDP